ncbi:MAG: NAD(P)-dependent oxidoreductase [Desulfomonile tiedjei]|nr:NAD(P)-dependent oxidoreductase [Desulfomonile tiedjei]
MRFLVTGATGFIGSHMAELILAKGWEAVCPVRDSLALRNLKGIPVRVIAAGDLEAEISVNGAFDYVIHLAGATRAPDYDGYWESNVKWTRELLEKLVNSSWKDSLKRFVLVSSQAAIGPSTDDGACKTESDPLCPVSLYGRSKAEAEQVALSFMDRVPVTIVRPPTVFGPRDTDVLGVFKCVRYRIAPYIAGPDRLVSIIYVEDLVEGILAAAMSPASEGGVYFLANPEPVVWRKFALEVARVMGKSSVAVPVPLFAMKLLARAGDIVGKFRGVTPLFRTEKLEEMKQIAWVCSPEKAFTDLRWRPRFSLDEAIRKTAAWYRENGWL